MQATLERLRRRREEEGDEGGFTLIELLIVIVILGILAAIVVFAVQNLTSSSSQASCSSDYKTTETAVEAFKAQVGFYPGDATNGTGAWAPTAPAVNTPTGGYTGNTATMSQLLNSYTSPGASSPIGPWLKDTPYNPGHYAITVAGPTAGNPNAVVSVIPPGTATNPCANAT